MCFYTISSFSPEVWVFIAEYGGDRQNGLSIWTSVTKAITGFKKIGNSLCYIGSAREVYAARDLLSNKQAKQKQDTL